MAKQVSGGIESRIKFFSEPGWTCKRCNEGNTFQEKFCKKCGRRNVAHERLQKSIKKKATLERDTWHCKACTFINQQGHRHCEICGTIRSDQEKEKPQGLVDDSMFDNTSKCNTIAPGFADEFNENVKMRKKKDAGDRKSHVSRFFGFITGSSSKGSSDTGKESSKSKGGVGGIRNSRLFQFLVGDKPSDRAKKDSNSEVRKTNSSTFYIDEKDEENSKESDEVDKIRITKERDGDDDKEKYSTDGIGRLVVDTNSDQFTGKSSPRHERKGIQERMRLFEKKDDINKHSDENQRKQKPMVKEKPKNKTRELSPQVLGQKEYKESKSHEYPTQMSQETGHSSGWTCKSCTYRNGDLPRCRVCDTERPRIEPNRPSKLMKRRMLRSGRSLKIADLQKQEEKQAHQKWVNITYFCRENNTMFIDDQFPPEAKSLYTLPRSKDNPTWLRCHDIRTEDDTDSKTDWVVYRSTPMADDIGQGRLGNCWFLSALAVLAERKELLERIILTKQFCKEGAYHLRLCKDGRWKIVLIDDFFPSDQYKRFLYSKAKRKQLWVPLIEKAAAKLYGCYEALVSGRTIEALALLTGEPCERIQLQEQEDDDIEIDEKQIWRKLLVARQSKYLMGTSCGSLRMQPSDHKHYEEMGLISNHAYSLLDIQDIVGNQLVKIRNPWGTVSWKGKWSDQSSSWQTISDSIKQGLQLNGNDKGIFWMCLQDFMRYFDSVEICKARPNWNELRIKGSFPPHADQPWKFVTLTIAKRTKVDLALFQRTVRGEGLSKEPFVDMMVVVLANSRNKGQNFSRVICNSRRAAKPFTGCEAELEPGTYTVACLAFKHWQTGVPLSSSFKMETLDELNKDFVLTIHSSGVIQTEEFDTTNPSFHFALSDVIVQLATDKGKKQELSEGLFLHSLWWYGAIFVIENTSDQYGQVKCDTSSSSYLISTRGTFITMDCVPPKHRQVIMILTPLEPLTGWSTNRSMQFLLSPDAGLYKEWRAPEGVQHVPEISSDLAPLHAPRPIPTS